MFYNTKSFGLPSNFPSRDQRWGRTGERARESGVGWGATASESGLRENFLFILLVQF